MSDTVFPHLGILLPFGRVNGPRVETSGACPSECDEHHGAEGTVLDGTLCSQGWLLDGRTATPGLRHELLRVEDDAQRLRSNGRCRLFIPGPTPAALGCRSPVPASVTPAGILEMILPLPPSDDDGARGAASRRLGNPLVVPLYF